MESFRNEGIEPLPGLCQGMYVAYAGYYSINKLQVSHKKKDYSSFENIEKEIQSFKSYD